MKYSFLAMTVGVGMTATCLSAQVTLKDVIPEDTVFLAGVANMENLCERFERTGLHEAWNHDDLREMRSEFVEEMTEGFNEMVRELGLDPEQVGLPTGMIGFALFAVRDAEMGMPSPAILAVADFGDRADDIAELIDTATARAEREMGLVYEIRDVSGRDVFVIDFASLENGPEADRRRDDPGVRRFEQPSPQDRFKVMHIVRDGNLFMLSNEMSAVTDAIDRIDGRLQSGFTDRQDYRAMMDQLGDHDAFAMLLTRDAMSLVSGMDPMGMMMMIGPMLQSVFGDIRGFASGLRVDGSQAMLESRSVAYMPMGKGGLMKLLDVQAPRENLPAFVGSNATGYNQMRFAFEDVVDTIRNIIRSNPLLQMQAGQEFAQIEPTLREFFSVLGPSIHFVNSVTRPIELHSVQSLVAIDCKDVQKLENLIGEYAPMMGLEPRDFLGHRIYTIDADMGMMFGGMGGMPSISIGMGGGYAMFGPTESVEQSLRAISQPDQAPRLESDEQYRMAVATLGNEPVTSWGYTDVVESIRAQVEVMRLTLRQAMEEVGDEMMDPAFAAEIDVDMDWLDKIDFDMIRRYIGPSVGRVRSTDDGFVMDVYLLEAKND